VAIFNEQVKEKPQTQNDQQIQFTWSRRVHWYEDCKQQLIWK